MEQGGERFRMPTKNTNEEDLGEFSPVGEPERGAQVHSDGV